MGGESVPDVGTNMAHFWVLSHPMTFEERLDPSIARIGNGHYEGETFEVGYSERTKTLYMTWGDRPCQCLTLTELAMRWLDGIHESDWGRTPSRDVTIKVPTVKVRVGAALGADS